MQKRGTLAVAMIFAAVPLGAIYFIDGRLASALLSRGQLETVVALLFAGAIVQIVGALLSGMAYSAAINGSGSGVMLARLNSSWTDVLVNGTSIAAFVYVAWVAIAASPRM
jgi:hypothetical protein